MDRRGGRAVDLKVRVARQGRELCGFVVKRAMHLGHLYSAQVLVGGQSPPADQAWKLWIRL